MKVERRAPDETWRIRMQTTPREQRQTDSEDWRAEIAREEFAVLAMRRAVADLAEVIGSYPAMWRWGDGYGGVVLSELDNRLREIGLSRHQPKRQKGVRSTPATIPWGTRYRIMERDGFRCIACSSQIDLTMDHVRPQSAGGSSEDDNLQTLCRPCNTSKGKKPMDEWLAGR